MKKNDTKTEQAGEQQTRKPDAAFIKRVWPKLEKAAERAQPEKCPNCNRILHYYDGCLGYEAMRCLNCGYERDLNAAANAKATAEREAEEKARGIWDERTKTFIKPSGTVKQGRRPMFQPFENKRANRVSDWPYADLKREYNTVTAQRDELLGALKDLLTHHRVRDLPDTDTLTPRIKRARAAIAKAEGRAQ